MLALHCFLTREHLVCVAADSVDLAVVDDHAVGMSSLPARVGVGREARVNHRDSRLEVLVLQIEEETAEVADKEHSLIYNRAARERNDICVLVALLKHSARDVESAVKVKTLLHARGTLNEALLDVWHAVESALTDDLCVGGHFSPAEDGQSFLARDNFK